MSELQEIVDQRLRQAALLLVMRGWCRIDRQDAQGRLCMLGAMGIVNCGSPFANGCGAIELSMIETVKSRAEARYPDASGQGIGYINDRIVSRRDEAVELLWGPG